MALLQERKELPATDLQTMLDRVFDEFPFAGDFAWARMPHMNVPALNLYEKDGRYELEVSVPGYDTKDVNIEVSGSTVTVSGSHSESDEKRDARYHRREIRTGSFRRSVTLPQDIDADKVEASLKGGILNVRLTPTMPISPKKIEIKSS